MKLFIRKQRAAAFFLLMLLILFCTSNTGYGQDKGQAETINPPLSERTPQIRDAIVAAVPGVNTADDVTAAHLAAITTLNPAFTGITSLKSGDFNGLTALTYLNLSGNSIGDISVLEDLTTLTTLYLAGTSISDISALKNLTKLTTLYLTHNSISDISVLENLTALTELSLSENSVSDISALENLTALKTLILGKNSISDISVVENLPALESLYLGENPISDYGPLRRLVAALKAVDRSLTLDITIPLEFTEDNSPARALAENTAPEFTEGTTATRTVAENTVASVNIGTAVAATDADNDTLTYTLSGTDAASFGIVSTTGQLQTSAALDFETKNSYSVTVDVSDDNGGSDAIDVTINVTNVNEAPVFSQGTRATRAVAENTAAGTNIGAAFTATDPDSGDTLTYSLRRGDRNSFRIDPNTGQLQTKAALDYETKSSYNNLAVRATDSSGLTDAIIVTINVTDVDENRAPSFTEGSSATRSVAENTDSGANIGTAVSATDPDTTDVLTYTLDGTDAAAFSINSTNGQLRTNAALNYESDASYSVTVSVSDGNGGSDSISVTINVTNVNEAPSFTDGTNTTRSIAENTASDTNIGSAVSATDPDANTTLTYTLGGPDAAAFSIVSASGQLRTSAALDYETKTFYSVSITVSDSKLTDTIDVTINITDVDENRAPSFADGDNTTRSVAENTASGQDIGSAVSATDPDNDTLTYTLRGTDAASFTINSTNGQLRTSAALDYEAKTSYSVTIIVSDSKLTDSIDVTINVTDVGENRAPSFTDGDNTTRSVAENTASGTNIGTAVSATDPDTTDVLTYTLDGTDAAAFSINSTNGQLRTNAALNYESDASYSVTVSVSDGNERSDSISVTINVTNVNEAPAFEHSSLTRSVAENTRSGTSFGNTLDVSDPDRDTLSYTLGGPDATSFSFDSTTRRLKTSAALDYETKTSYSLTVSVSDGSLKDTITITVNVTNVNEAPSFTDGPNATRSIAENTASGTNIGTAVAATDPDTGDTLTYTLNGTDAAAFSINSTNGQLRTSAALDYETKTSYTVTIIVSDSELTDTIDVSINVTNVDENRAPSFTEGTSTTRSIAENTAANTNIGGAVSATDPDDDTLAYTLDGDDADAFGIDSTNGQLRTSAALDYETKNEYTVTVSVSDGNSGSDSISVTINVTEVVERALQVSNNAPEFTDGDSATRSIAENTAPGTDIGSPIAATDADTGDTLTYDLSGTDAAAFSILSKSGQLRTSALLDYETKTSYTVTVSVSDSNGGTDSISVTINVTNVNEVPSFSDSVNTIRTIVENTAADTNIGTAVSATDPDTGDTLTYTLSGTDADSFSIVSTSGQLRTKAALDYETKSSYSVTITVSDSGSLTDSISVTISVAPVDGTPIDPPLSARTQQVRDAIVAAVPGVNSPDDVTAAHLAAITTLILNNKNPYSDKGITSLKSGDFDGLTGMTALEMSGNSISDISPLKHLTNLKNLTLSNNSIKDISPLKHLTKLIYLTLSNNSIKDISPLKHLTELIWLELYNNSIEDISALAGMTKLEDLELQNTSISDISALKHLTKLDWLELQNNSIEDISALAGMTELITLRLYNTSIEDISALEDLTKLENLFLHKNSIKDISALEDLTKLENLFLHKNSIKDISALEGLINLEHLILHENSIEDISALENLTKLEWLTLLNNSISDVSALEHLTALTNHFLKGNPISDYGPLRRLIAAVKVIEGHPGLTLDITIPEVPNNNAPVFTDGPSTTRSIAENTAAGTNIGTAVAATDLDTADTLTYHLGGTDASSFSIVRTSGQLRTRAALDYETKSTYTVTLSVSDGNGGSDSISVTINITDAVGAAPSAQVSPVIPENTALLTNFPNPFNPETWIPYQLAKPAEVTLTIYDIRGVVVRELKLGHQAAGVYISRSRAIHWDGRNNTSEQVATGIYFYTLKAGDFTATRKLLIRK